MIMISFRSKRDKDKMLRKAKEMAEYVEDWIECIEDARHGSRDEEEEDDMQYAQRGSHSMRMRNRYGYGK